MSELACPLLESIDAYNKEIENQQKALDAFYKQQYTFMLKNDETDMSALDTSIKKAEQDIGALKTQLGQVMGADMRGQRGNQLTQGDSGSYIDGMLHAYGNIGDGVKAEQERKNEAAAYQDMLHAYGNIVDGVKAEQERKNEAEPIPTTRPDPSDPGSSFWDTHEPFRPGDPELAYAPLKPEHREDTTGRNDTYGSAPDSFADTGLVEPPKINDFDIGDEKHMTDGEAGYVLAELTKQRDHVEKLGRRSTPYAEFDTFPDRTEYYAAADEANKKMVEELNKKIDAVSTRLGDKYMTYKNNSGLNAKHYYNSTTISDDELAEEAIARSILKGKNRNQLQIISCGVDEDLSITVGAVDEEKRTLELGDINKLQDIVMRLNDKASISFPFVGTLMNTFQGVLMEVKDLVVNGIQGASPTEYATEAGRYITFDLKVYSEVDDKIFTLKYFRYPSGLKHSHVYVMD